MSDQGFFSLHMPDLLEQPRVSEHKDRDGVIQAIVYLADGVSLHVKEGEIARKIAALFTEAARILEPQDDELAQFRAWKAEREQLSEASGHVDG